MAKTIEGKKARGKARGKSMGKKHGKETVTCYAVDMVSAFTLKFRGEHR
jgi:hypothetical protein